MDEEAQQQNRFDSRKALSWLGLILLTVVIAALVWYGGHVLLLVFAGILFAVVLRAPMGFLIRRTGMPDKVAYTIVLLLILAVLVGFGLLVGPRVLNQAGEFGERVPVIFNNARDYLESRPWGRWIVGQVGLGLGAEGGGEAAQAAGVEGGGQGSQVGAEQSDAAEAARRQGAASTQGGQAGSGGGADLGNVASQITGITRTITTTLAHLALVVVLGLFLAANPGLYRRGLVRMFPSGAQQRAEEVVDELGRTLQYWLVGQLVLMFITGLLTGIGLVILGIPLALALAFFVFLMEFIPFVGPIIGFIPILMMAGTQGGTTILWALILYLAVQQIEGNLLTPLIQERVLSLPPALTITAVFLGGALFGPLGVIVATPLMAVVYVMVKMLYVHDELGQRVEVPGKTEPA